MKKTIIVTDDEKVFLRANLENIARKLNLAIDNMENVSPVDPDLTLTIRNLALCEGLLGKLSGQ